jgi:hypothetical protein
MTDEEEEFEYEDESDDGSGPRLRKSEVKPLLDAGLPLIAGAGRWLGFYRVPPWLTSVWRLYRQTRYENDRHQLDWPAIFRHLGEASDGERRAFASVLDLCRSMTERIAAAKCIIPALVVSQARGRARADMRQSDHAPLGDLSEGKTSRGEGESFAAPYHLSAFKRGA